MFAGFFFINPRQETKPLSFFKGALQLLYMPLKLYNSLTKRKEAVRPSDGKAVRIYSCGPTVYGDPHIGNLRAFAASDLLRRYLKYRGFKVKHVMNLTDVDDKTIRNSQRKGTSLKEYTERYKKAFFRDIDALNMERVEVYPEATKHIPQMVRLVQTLLEKGYAYRGKDGCIYYDISKFRGYGKLSHLKLSGLRAGARVKHDEYDKAHASDFALWKAWTPEDGEVFWETPLGKGRPGWHVECSAMSMHYLGPTLDLHTGGIDLLFPHHENEIAQSEAATGKPFVLHWFHNGHLIAEGRKMSKSLGNFYTLRDLEADPLAVRYVLLSAHYRQKLDFSRGKVEEAVGVISRLKELVRNLQGVSYGKVKEAVSSKLANETEKAFIKSMDDDLDIAQALAAVFELARKSNQLISGRKLGEAGAGRILKTLQGFDSVLGLRLFEIDEWLSMSKAGPGIRKLMEEREALRKRKDWKEADRIRDALKRKGVILEDTPEGPRWRKA
jgi:cysteinyl-tRNA synthetase